MDYDPNSSPEAIFANTTLTIDDKLMMLDQWEYDLREMETAASENMPESALQDHVNDDLLQRIQHVKLKLGAPMSDDAQADMD